MNTKLQYLPTILLISPDKEIIAQTTMDTKLIDKALEDAGIQEKDPIFVKITDTTNSTENLVSKGSWWFAHDDEGQGSKIVEEPNITGDQMESVIHIGKYVYPNIWTWGEVAMSLPSSLDLNGKEYISVTYRTNNNLVLTLPMKGTDDSYGPYGRTIPASEDNEWITAIFSMDQFGQPTWSELLDGLKIEKLESVAFMTSYANGIDVTIDVKDIRFLDKKEASIVTANSTTTAFQATLHNRKLQLSIPSKEIYNLKLTNIIGREIYSRSNLILEKGMYQFSLADTFLAQGVYLLTLSNESGLKQTIRIQY